MLVFGITRFHLFLTMSTTRLVFSQGAVTAMLALAFLVPLTTDTYDLSIGEMISLAIVLMAWFSQHSGIPVALVAVGIVAFSGLVGFLSGFVVVRLRVNSLIATLGVGQVLIALQLYVSQNRQIAGKFSRTVVNLGNGNLFGVPFLDIDLLLLALVTWFVLEQTPVGRRMFAVGGNREAARLAGIGSDRIVWGSLVVSGAMAGLAGVLYTIQVGAYTTDIGQGYLFPALAAVFLGASQLSQRPNVWGTLIAYFALAFGIQGLSLQYGAGAFWVSPLFQGLALILAVAVASSRGSIGRGRDGTALRRMMRPKAVEAQTVSNRSS
jgi:ribose transport system permease protein